MRAKVLGPLEPLLARDDITDIMIYGPAKCFIEVNGEIQATDLRFRDNNQLLSLCQRMVSQSGRRVDKVLADLRRPSSGRVALSTSLCHRSRFMALR